MQVVRTILWVLLVVGLLAFSYFNWQPVTVTIWENLVLETKVPMLVIVSFLLGLIPAWMLHRGTKWRLTRRIRTLENAARASSATMGAATVAAMAGGDSDPVPVETSASPGGGTPAA